MSRLQTLGEAVELLQLLDPKAGDAAMDYLADLGRVDVVLTWNGPQLVVA